MARMRAETPTIIGLFLTIILAISFLLPATIAYSNNSLQQYYTFGDGPGATSLYDSRTGGSMYIRFSPAANPVGVQGNTSLQAMFWNQNPLTASTVGNETGINYGYWNWSVNYWENASYTAQNQYNYFSADAANYAHESACSLNDIKYRFFINSTGHYTVLQALYCNGGTWYSAMGNADLTWTNETSKTWQMITIIYNNTADRIHFYLSTHYITYLGFGLGASKDVLALTAYNTSYDEMSIWNYSDLNTSDINFLYNNGKGLTYAQTLSGSNTTASSGTDEPSIDVMYSFYDICWFPGVGETLPILCHQLDFYNNGGIQCGITKREYCVLGCSDNQSYWESFNVSPASMNYTGRCTTCPSNCNVENSTSCYDTVVVERCVNDGNNCLFKQRWYACDPWVGDVCLNGQCIYRGTTSAAEANATAEQLPYLSDVFSCEGKSVAYGITVWLLILLVAGIVSVAFPIALGMGPSVASLFGVFAIVAVTIFAAVIGCIPVWVIVILFIMSAATVAIFLRNIFVSDGGGSGGVG